MTDPVPATNPFFKGLLVALVLVAPFWWLVLRAVS